jgi:hypothetical protein
VVVSSVVVSSVVGSIVSVSLAALSVVLRRGVGRESSVEERDRGSWVNAVPSCW